MTGVTHGADAARLDEISGQLRVQGEQVGQIGETLGVVSGTLREAWSGPDMEHLLAQTDQLRPAIARTGASLVAWADALREQADQQRTGSGEGGSRGSSVVDNLVGGRGAGSGSGRPDLSGMTGVFRDLVGGMSAGGGSPFGGLPAGSMANAIGDGPQTDPGELRQPGSVTTSDTAEGKKSAFKIEAGTATTVGNSRESVDSEGRSVQTTTVTAEASVVGSVGGESKKGAGIALEDGGGTRVSYSVTAPVGVDPLSIDPADPQSWPPGTSVRFDEEFYATLGLSGSFRGLLASGGLENGVGGYVEVSKGEGDQVVVLVGDEKFSRASQEVGVGTPDANVKVGGSNEVSSGTAKEVVIDLSTPEGRATYQTLLEGGEAPTVDDPGVVDVADLQVVGVSKSAGASGTLGDWSAGGNLAEWSTGGVQRTHADGTTSLEWNEVQNETQIGGVTVFDANGDMIEGESTVYMRLEGVNASDAGNYNRNYLNEDVSPTGEHNVVIDLTHGDISQMKTQAAQAQAAMINADPDAYPHFPGAGEREITSSDVLRHVATTEDASISLNGTDKATQQILLADSDLAVVKAMMSTGGPLEFQQELAADYYQSKGERITPVGEVKSQRSA